MEICIVYIIENPEGVYYKGYTIDISRRLEEHSSTKKKIYFQPRPLEAGLYKRI
jgi:predicted GIY-YIG superfamily endonuclease